MKSASPVGLGSARWAAGVELCAACLLAMHLPVAGSLVHRHDVYRRGTIPAAQLAAALAAHREGLQAGGPASREAARGQTPAAAAGTLRGGSVFAVLVQRNLWRWSGQLSLQLNVNPQTLLLVWRQADVAARRALSLAWKMLWLGMCQFMWLGLGLEMQSDAHRETLPVAIRAMLCAFLQGLPSAAVPCSSDGPIRELVQCVISAGCALADVEVDFLVAVRYCLLQFSMLAFGRPQSADTDADGAAESEAESDSASSQPEQVQQETGGGFTRIFLSEHTHNYTQICAAADAEALCSSMHTHNHGVHSCQRAGCPQLPSPEPEEGHAELERMAEQTSSHQESRRCGTPAFHSSAFDSDAENDVTIEGSELGDRVKVPIHLRSPGCNTASIVGSWNNWGQRYDLARMGDSRLGDSGDFLGLLALPPGRYEFKFILDGVWRTSDGWPVDADSRGILNNILEVPFFRVVCCVSTRA